MKTVRELQNSQRAEKYGVANSAIGNIWKYCQKLEDCILSSEPLLCVKKHCVCKPTYDQVDSTCWNCFCQHCAKGHTCVWSLTSGKAHM